MQMIWLVSGMLLQGQTPGPPQSPWAWHYYWMGGGWGFSMMIISMVIFWGLIIGGVILLGRFLSTSFGTKPSQDALEILKQRYAKGEIEKEEFEAKKADILA